MGLGLDSVGAGVREVQHVRKVCMQHVQFVAAVLSSTKAQRVQHNAMLHVKWCSVHAKF